MDFRKPYPMDGSWGVASFVYSQRGRGSHVVAPSRRVSTPQTKSCNTPSRFCGTSGRKKNSVLIVTSPGGPMYRPRLSSRRKTTSTDGAPNGWKIGRASCREGEEVRVGEEA